MTQAMRHLAKNLLHKPKVLGNQGLCEIKDL